MDAKTKTTPTYVGNSRFFSGKMCLTLIIISATL